MFNWRNWIAPSHAKKDAGAKTEDVDPGKGVAPLAWHSIITDSYGLLWKMIIRPPRSKYSVSDLGPPKFRLGSEAFQRRDVQLTNDRNLTLECSLFCPLVPSLDTGKKKYPCVVYLHGNCSSRLESADSLRVLLTRAVCVFCLDFSGSGLSQGEFISLGHYEQMDLHVAVKYLRSLNFIGRIGLWGRSMGAATSVLSSAADWTLGALVIDSAFSSLPRVAKELVNNNAIIVPDFIVTMALNMVRKEIIERAGFDIEGLLPIRSAPNARSPVLFAVASDDDFVMPQHTYDLHRVWGGNEKKLVTFTGGHNGTRPTEFLTEAAEFLKDRLTQVGISAEPAIEVQILGDNREANKTKAGKTGKAATGSIEKSGRSPTPSIPCHEGYPAAKMQSPREDSNVDDLQVMSMGTGYHSEDPDEFSASLPRVPTSRPTCRTVSMNLAKQLVAMGFSADDAREAANFNATLEMAIDWLLQQSQKTMASRITKCRTSSSMSADSSVRRERDLIANAGQTGDSSVRQEREIIVI